jgi:hypothetical protein
MDIAINLNLFFNYKNPLFRENKKIYRLSYNARTLRIRYIFFIQLKSIAG